MKDKIIVQLYCWEIDFPHAFDEEVLTKFEGEQRENQTILFDTLNKAKNYVENYLELVVREDTSSISEEFGEAIHIDYTRKEGFMKGINFATIWNINWVDRYFLE